MMHSQPTWLYVLKYTSKWQDPPKLTWLDAFMYAPACSTQRLAELKTPGTRRYRAGGILQEVFGRQQAACSMWQVEESVWWSKS